MGLEQFIMNDERPSLNKLIADVESFLARSRMSRTEFGKKVMNDSRFVHDIISGHRKDVGMNNGDKCYAFMEKYKA